jgi:hypothetical protein
MHADDLCEMEEEGAHVFRHGWGNCVCGEMSWIEPDPAINSAIGCPETPFGQDPHDWRLWKRDPLCFPIREEWYCTRCRKFEEKLRDR